MTVSVYGASDDLIEVDGDIREEFGWYPSDDDKPALLAFSDGTVLRIVFGEAGIWRITPAARGTATLTVEQAAEDDDSGTDKATLDGDVRWVVLGTDLARADA